MNKKIIFFDGDGTLWYPRKTKYNEGPWWIYKLTGDHKAHTNHLMMIPGVLQVLKKLRKKGIVTIILSTHPHPPKTADEVINHKVKHFKLTNLFDEVYATREFHKSKGEFMLKILKERNISKKYALMIGDSYFWDYKSARDVGIDAFLINTDYNKQYPNVKRIKNKIENMKEIFSHL